MSRLLPSRLSPRHLQIPIEQLGVAQPLEFVLDRRLRRHRQHGGLGERGPLVLEVLGDVEPAAARVPVQREEEREV